MVLPISGFLPVPLPMMIPFMGAQSLVIGKMFGEGFQYGKRKISAMPNEEFNKLTFESMMSNAREEIKASVPTMAAAMQDMKPLVDVVVREFLQYINEVSKTLQEVTVTGFDEAAHLIGTHVGHPPSTPTTQPTPTIPITPEGTLAPPPVSFPKSTGFTKSELVWFRRFKENQAIFSSSQYQDGVKSGARIIRIGKQGYSVAGIRTAITKYTKLITKTSSWSRYKQWLLK